MEVNLKNIEIQNISLRLHDTHGRTHIKFTDRHGIQRLGRFIHGSKPIEQLKSVFARVQSKSGILVPDGISKLPDGGYCFSVKHSGQYPLTGIQKLETLVEPLRHLHKTGINHLSLDEYSYTKTENTTSLILWGDGLLNVHQEAPYEVLYGGVPDAVSDLYMLASTALRMNWLSGSQAVKSAETLCSNNIVKRWKEAEKYGYTNRWVGDFSPITPEQGVTIIQGGSWQIRDMHVNQLVITAASKGWMCRVVRCSAGELGRPMPDMPSGTVTRNPEDLLNNAFSNHRGIENLLIVQDLQEKQEDFSAILEELVRLIPVGVHLAFCGASVPEVFHGRRTTLEGRVTTAVDHSLAEIPLEIAVTGTGPSWYGPRCRVPVGTVKATGKPALSVKVLFREGAWRYIAALSGKTKSDQKAESLNTLGRYTEALDLVSKTNSSLRGKILMGLGKYEEAVKQLSNSGEPLLLAKAYLGNGNVHQALDVIKDIPDPEVLPLLARLYDLSGSPSSAFLPLKHGLEAAAGVQKVTVYCALRNLEMRLGMYDEALEHAEAAVALARGLTSVSMLVKSLQERGRTLQVTGNWRKALEDFQAAVRFHDESVLSFTRPPHIDLYVLQLKMGQIHEADITRNRVTRYLESGGKLSRQMLNMLDAYRGVLLGSGDKALPSALRAAKQADEYGMELYFGISTLYAGQLYLQAGDAERGIYLLEQARSRGHLLGDRHLVCLSEIELLLQGKNRKMAGNELNRITLNLPEEIAAVQIITGKNRVAGFDLLLELPSPLLACRLADKFGLPDDPVQKKALIQHREEVLDQLTEEEAKSYAALFNLHMWQIIPEKSSAEKLLSKGVIHIISDWLQKYLENEAQLSDLAKLLNLERISVTGKPGMLSVPGNCQLYCSGNNAAAVAPFLQPVASVIAAEPVTSQHPERKDKLSAVIVGNSDVIKTVRLEIVKVANETVPVFLTGETGTGKELCARAIHNGNISSKGTFVPVDCGAIPESLLESEFFGAAPGAYTGISSPRRGLLEEADGGTLFLDEIGNLPLQMQAKLLRVLEFGIFRRLGETRERHTDFRLIAATNSVVGKQIAEGSFRADLYYRISVIKISLPPLRKRLEDIPVLIPLFTSKSVSRGALQLLLSHLWPGNIRELSNVLKRASISSSGNVIKRSHISFSAVTGSTASTLTLHEAVKRHIRSTVDSFGGSRSKAAKALKCDPKTLRKYLSEN